MKKDEGFDLLNVTLVICGTIIVIGGSIKVMKFLGFFPDFTDDSLLKNKALNPLLYNENKTATTIRGQEALRLVKDIYDAKGYIYDNEDQVNASIRQAGSEVNLSYMAYLFSLEYKRDMASYINSFTNKEQRKSIIKAINQLPKF